jgi:hypothetical protein
VIGNPPYRFLSGRDSPIAALRREGQIDKSVKLGEEVGILAERFPESSAGCKDRYKWFIDRATECLKPGGYLGYVVPNTWLMYPRYLDLRVLLQARGRIEEVLDLGAHPFTRACVPVATLVWTKMPSRKDGLFRLAKLSKEDWRTVEAGHASLGNLAGSIRTTAYVNSDGDITTGRTLSHGKPSASGHTSHVVRLGDLVTLREGTHAIRAIGLDVSRKKSRLATAPVIIDKTMGPLDPPEIGYIQAPDLHIKTETHSGERFFIRKTGDRIVASPCPAMTFAVAHQNVYVGKVRNKSVSMYAVLGILNSSAMTAIYRMGPGGQEGRPHAQLRILFLNQLPIVCVPEEFKPLMEIAPDEVKNIVTDLMKGGKHPIEPIPGRFPSDKRGALKTAERIALIWESIDNLARMMPNPRSAEILRSIDSLADSLYSFEKSS